MQANHTHTNFEMKLSHAKLYSMILIFIFLVPTFSGVLRIGDTYFGEMIQVVYITIIFTVFMIININNINNTIVKISLWISLLFIILIYISIFRDIQKVIINDLFEFYRPIYALIIFLTSFLIFWNFRNLRYLCHSYIIIISILSVYALFESFGGNIANNISMFLYKGSKKVLEGKSTGSFSSTYTFASFMIFGGLFTGIYYLYSKKKLYMILSIISFLSVILTQSRSGFIAMIFTFIMIFLLYWKYKNFKNKIIFYLLSTIIISIISVYLIIYYNELKYALPYLVNGLTILLEKGVSDTDGGSFNIRYQQLIFVYESQKEFPFFGVGIGKEYARLLESYYALYFYRYGLIGILISIFIFITFFILSLRAYNISVKEMEYKSASLFLSMHLWMYSFPIMALSSAIHDQVKIALFFYGGLGVLASFLYNEKKSRG